MRKRTKVILVSGLAIFALAAFVLGGMVIRARLEKIGKGLEGEIVRIESAQEGELVEFVNAPGEVEPLNKVAISAKVMARIVEMPYEEGDVVTKGDPDAEPPVPASVLVRLDATELEASLRSAEARLAAQAAQIEAEKARIEGQKAQLKGTQASLDQAEREYKRCCQLRESRDISESEMENSQSRLDELTAQFASAKYSLEAGELGLEVMKHNLEAADADVARARDAVSYTVITSPIDGVVTRRNAKVGELVVTGTMNNPGTVILEVADLSKMQLVVQVDESDIGGVEAGQTADARIHAYPGEKFEGVVDSIALTHDYIAGGGKYYKTKILLESNGQRIYSGLTADVDILTRKHENIIKVPSQAVLAREVDDLPLAIREGNASVDTKKSFATVVYRFVAGKTVVTPVTIGATDATHTVIEAGLTADDKVIVGPYKVLEGLKHDAAVRDEKVVEAEKKAKEDEKAKAEAAAKAGDSKDADTGSAGDSKADEKGDSASGIASTDSKAE